jgi:hypothetical protein
MEIAPERHSLSPLSIQTPKALSISTGLKKDEYLQSDKLVASVSAKITFGVFH